MNFLGKIFNYLIWILIAYLALQKIQLWKKETLQSGVAIKNQTLEVLNEDGSTVKQNLLEPESKKIIVFWATWCGPCRVELLRLQKLFDKKQIPENSLIAISIGEEKNVVLNAIKDRKYTFPVGLDQDGKIAQQFGITATPTVALIHKNHITEISSGLSLAFEKKLKDFILSDN